MDWLPFALLAYVVWACANLLCKIIICEYVKSVNVNLITLGLWNLLPIFLIPVHGLHLPDIKLLTLILFSGILYLLILIPFFKALAVEEASRVIPLWRFTPLFSLLFSSSLTGEALDLHQISAFLLLVAGGFLVSLRSIHDLIKPSKAFYLMVFSSLSCGIYGAIAKYVYMQMSFQDGFSLMRISVGITILGLLIPRQNRVELSTTLKRSTPNIKALLLLNGFLEFAGLILYNFAVSLAPVSLVSASAGIQAVFVLLFSILLSVKFPKLMHEDTSQSVLAQKGIAVALIVIGTGMISNH